MEECAILDLRLHLQQHYASGLAGPNYEKGTQNTQNPQRPQNLFEKQ